MDISEVNNLTGVNLTLGDVRMMNAKIYEVIVKSVGVDGYCTYDHRTYDHMIILMIIDLKLFLRVIMTVKQIYKIKWTFCKIQQRIK